MCRETMEVLNANSSVGVEKTPSTFKIIRLKTACCKFRFSFVSLEKDVHPHLIPPLLVVAEEWASSHSHNPSRSHHIVGPNRRRPAISCLSSLTGQLHSVQHSEAPSCTLSHDVNVENAYHLCSNPDSDGFNCCPESLRLAESVHVWRFVVETTLNCKYSRGHFSSGFVH